MIVGEAHMTNIISVARNTWKRVDVLFAESETKKLRRCYSKSGEVADNSFIIYWPLMMTARVPELSTITFIFLLQVLSSQTKEWDRHRAAVEKWEEKNPTPNKKELFLCAWRRWTIFVHFLPLLFAAAQLCVLNWKRWICILRNMMSFSANNI